MDNIEFKLLTDIILEQRFNFSVLSSYKELTYDQTILLNLAYQNKVEKAVFDYYKKNPLLINEKHAFELKKNATLSASKRIFAQKKLDDISKEFIKNNIIPLNIKGPASSLQLYNNPITREYTDIDLVINEKDFAKVTPIMESLGYIEKNGLKVLHDNQNVQNKLIQKNAIHHLIFTNPTTPFRIEIHDNFFHDIKCIEKYNTENIIKRSIIIEYKGMKYYTPTLVDHSLLLLIHGTKHAWMTLHWVIDMIAIFKIEDQELHKNICIGISDLHLEKHICLIISLIKEIHPIEIPNCYFEFYNSEKNNIKKQLKITLSRLINFNNENSSIIDTINFALKYQSVFQSKKKSSTIFNYFLVSPTDANNIKIPNNLFWIHLLIRPFLVINRRIKRHIHKRNNET